jgi:hypothetical protein
MNKFEFSNDAYKNIPIKNIVFFYGIREGNITPSIGNEIDEKEIKYQIYYNNKLPISLKPEDFGVVLYKINNIYTIQSKNKGIFKIETFDKFNLVEFYRKGDLIFNWKDKIISDSKFIREIGKSFIQYENGEIVLYKIQKKTSPIKKKDLAKNNSLDTKIITMDLETIVINNIHIPYLLSWYDGTINKSYFISSLDTSLLENNILNMIKEAITDICIKKYKGYRIYLHNFSKFDSYFLIKHLAKIGKIKPIIHKGNIIQVKLIFNNYTVTFKDSYLLLPSSLRSLCKSFNVDNSASKDIFPYLLNNIDYSGVVPDYKYFSNISLDEYNNYKNRFINNIWNFKDEAIKYCVLDCISLFQVISKFNSMIFDQFRLNINNSPTLPSLSFNIFKTHYITKKNSKYRIHMLSGEIANNIRKGYTGGAVDMYIPRPQECNKIYAYDVNSLYPYVMSNFKLPVGNPTYFEGDIRKFKDKPFGFFFCKVITPNNISHPILQTHIKTEDGVRTVAPLGNWEGMYFSEELYDAEKYGYKFEIKWGYLFNSNFIFKNYVEELYKIRLQYPKSDPMNYIAKIILNSLYGRFGMDDNFSKIEVISKKDYSKFEVDMKDSIIDIVDLEHSYLVEIKNPKNELLTALDNGSETHNVNIAIAAAVTAYARIHMSQFKNNPNFPNLYYTDTDSVYFDGPLPDSFINSSELGKMKLEGIYDKAVFIAPKVYALKNQEGEIIKIKGLSKEAINNNITLELLEELLKKDIKLEFEQDKWYKHLDVANILIKDQLYTLKVTNNKRNLIYNTNDLLIGTVPFIIENGKIINK